MPGVSQPNAAGAIAAAIDTLGAASSNSDSESQIKKWAPIFIGLLGANLFVVLVVAGIGFMLCIKRGAKSSVPKPTYNRVRFAEDEGRPLDGFDDKRYSD
ncbi:hypothetical protein DFH09DRAFT_1327332 [Mycena vulgaris]|nr:hypothetical protein DFH09DRAFT_1327332 [Mycena vulgaris]